MIWLSPMLLHHAGWPQVVVTDPRWTGRFDGEKAPWHMVERGGRAGDNNTGLQRRHGVDVERSECRSYELPKRDVHAHGNQGGCTGPRACGAYSTYSQFSAVIKSNKNKGIAVISFFSSSLEYTAMARGQEPNRQAGGGKWDVWLARRAVGALVGCALAGVERFIGPSHAASAVYD